MIIFDIFTSLILHAIMMYFYSLMMMVMMLFVWGPDYPCRGLLPLHASTVNTKHQITIILWILIVAEDVYKNIQMFRKIFKCLQHIIWRKVCPSRKNKQGTKLWLNYIDLKINRSSQRQVRMCALGPYLPSFTVKFVHVMKNRVA